MLNNLKAEMGRHGVTVEDIRLLINKTDRCVRDKINGKTGFSFSEAIKIRDAFFCGLSLEYLFAQAREVR